MLFANYFTFYCRHFTGSSEQKHTHTKFQNGGEIAWDKPVTLLPTAAWRWLAQGRGCKLRLPEWSRRDAAGDTAPSQAPRGQS